jgi:hypothetical protein
MRMDTSLRPGKEPSILSRLARFAALVLLVFVTGGPGVDAAGSSERVGDFWNQQPSVDPGSGPRTAAPHLVRPKHRKAAAPVAVAVTPAVTPTFFVAVLGDNLAMHMAQGLQEALADKPEIAVLRKFKESSGLVRSDYYDWVKGAHDLLDSKEKIDVAVMLIGSNDDQPLQDGTSSYEIRSDKWNEIYTQRIDAIAAEFKAKKIPLLWVGVPIMRNENLSSAMAYINGLYREEAAKAGATFIDTWEGFVDEEGQYSDFGPDVSGQKQRLRAADGVHFTRAGTRKLAGFVEAAVRQAYDQAAPPVDLKAIVDGETGGPNALPPEVTVDVNTLIQRELSKNAPDAAAKGSDGSMQASVPLPDVPRDPVIPLKPAAGPIVPLTTPPLSPDGALATRSETPTATLGSEGLALLERTLVEGKPLDAKPGRADDFSWPRP